MAAFAATTGADTIVGTADDDEFVFFNRATLQTGDSFSGGAGVDTLRILEADGLDYLFSLVTLSSFEALSFSATTPGHLLRARFNADQFGGQVSNTLAVTGATASTDVVLVFLTAAGSFSAAGWTFTNYTDQDAVVVFGTDGADTITGSAARNTLTGFGGDDTLTGGADVDVLDGGTGADTLAGGLGGDLYVVDNAGDVVTEGVGAGFDLVSTTLLTYIAPANVESISFSGTGNFSGGGNALNNFISGGAGNDVFGFIGTSGGFDQFDGQGGNDTFAVGLNVIALGGAGDDDYRIYQDGVTIVENGGAGTDRVEVIVGSSFTLPVNFEILVFSSTGPATGIGNEVDNQITGSSAGSLLRGLAGNDLLVGQGGDDTFDGGTGADSFVGGTGFDTVTYAALTTGVTVNLALNIAAGGEAAGDTFSGVENLIGTAMDDDLRGDAAANTIDAGAGADIIVGVEGADTLRGMAGADSIDGGIGADVIEGGDGDDVLLGENVLSLSNLPSSGADTITGGDGNDTIFGGAGSDTLSGGAGNDTLFQQAGRGGAFGNLAVHVTVFDWGADVMDGGTGFDRAFWDFSNQTTGVVFALGAPEAVSQFSIGGAFAGSVTGVEEITIKGSVFGNNRLTGGALGDALVGGQANDTLSGLAGNDTLSSGLDGVDVLAGGSGDDFYNIENTTTTVVEAVNEGRDAIFMSVAFQPSYDLANFANVEQFYFTGTQAITLIAAADGSGLFGGGGADTLQGNVGADTLDGGAGNDVLRGEGGDDLIYGGAGADQMTGGAGDDFYVVDDVGDVLMESVGGGHDRIQFFGAIGVALNAYTLPEHVEDATISIPTAFSVNGNAENNTINVSTPIAGSLLLRGMGGTDSLSGSTGDDTLDGGSGADALFGDVGSDTASYASASAGVRVLFESFGSATGDAVGDTFSSIENIAGSAFDDVLGGDFRNNVLSGAAGADTLSGQAGADTLVGGAGNDRLDGGDGVDIAAFSSARASNMLVAFGGTVAVLNAGAHETDRLTTVETLQFADQTVSAATLTAFRPLDYVASHNDLIGAFGANAPIGFEHFIASGFFEGRSQDQFDGFQYLASYTDLLRAIGPNDSLAAQHFISNGFSEGRARDLFDGFQYLASYTDLLSALGPSESLAAQHFVANGFAEGRVRDAFDGIRYIAGYNDLIAVFGANEALAVQHFVVSGFSEGRQRDAFDPFQYIASHGDLIGAFGANGALGSQHFVANGFAEGRARDTFDAAQYLANYADLQAAFGNNLFSATLHYIQNGFAEGRTDDPFG